MLDNEEYEVNGRILSNGDVNEIIEMVEMYPNLGKEELIKTICVNLRWTSVVGGKKEKGIEKFLLKLEKEGAGRTDILNICHPL